MKGMTSSQRPVQSLDLLVSTSLKLPLWRSKNLVSLCSCISTLLNSRILKPDQKTMAVGFSAATAELELLRMHSEYNAINSGRYPVILSIPNLGSDMSSTRIAGEMFTGAVKEVSSEPIPYAYTVATSACWPPLHSLVSTLASKNART